MSHFHYPDGTQIRGAPNDTASKPNIGDTVTIGTHTGIVVNNRPYGDVHDSPYSNLPMDPQHPGFSPSRRDVIIRLDELPTQ